MVIILWILCALFTACTLAASRWWWQTPANDPHCVDQMIVVYVCMILALAAGFVATQWAGRHGPTP